MSRPDEVYELNKTAKYEIYHKGKAYIATVKYSDTRASCDVVYNPSHMPSKERVEVTKIAYKKCFGREEEDDE